MYGQPHRLYPSRQPSKQELEERIAAGNPSPVSYEVHRYVEHPVSGRLHLIPVLAPVHLRRAPDTQPQAKEALRRLLDAANDSDGAQYGTLSTRFVRDVCGGAL